MKTGSKFFKIISVALIVFLMFGTIPTVLYAEGNKAAATSEIQPKKDPQIVGEDVNKRESNVKHFLLDDMTYVAAVYPYPVHYKDNGKWEDIDNSIINQKDDAGKDILSNKSNDFKVKISNSSGDNKSIKIQKDKYEIEWEVGNSKSITPEITQNATSSEDISENDKKMTLPNIASKINLKNVFPDIDYNYQIGPDSIKENNSNQ